MHKKKNLSRNVDTLKRKHSWIIFYSMKNQRFMECESFAEFERCIVHELTGYIFAYETHPATLNIFDEFKATFDFLTLLSDGTFVLEEIKVPSGIDENTVNRLQRVSEALKNTKFKVSLIDMGNNRDSIYLQNLKLLYRYQRHGRRLSNPQLQEISTLMGKRRQRFGDIAAKVLKREKNDVTVADLWYALGQGFLRVDLLKPIDENSLLTWVYAP